MKFLSHWQSICYNFKPISRLSLINLIDGEIRAKKLMTVHKKMDEADIELFSLGDESDGTKRLFDYIPLILDLIQGGKVFIVDEMERSLHPSLIKQIILLFYKHSKDVSSQLIFTTHESSLMDQKIFRRDEIWLMKKDNNGYPALLCRKLGIMRYGFLAWWGRDSDKRAYLDGGLW